MGCGSGVTPNQFAPVPEGAHKVFCVKFQRDMEGLQEVPFEGHPLASASTTTFEGSVEVVG